MPSLHNHIGTDPNKKKENIFYSPECLQKTTNFNHPVHCQFAAIVAAIILQVNIVTLISSRLKKNRGTYARRVAMYLAHTKLSINLNEIGRFFSRHKSTVSQSCAIIEDLRDDQKFDEKLEQMEQIIDAAIAAKLFLQPHLQKKE